MSLRFVRLTAATALLAHPLGAQTPLSHWTEAVDIRYGRPQPVIAYSLTIAPDDTTGWNVEMRIRNAPAVLRLGMARHPEYYERWWRYVDHVEASGPRGVVAVFHSDSAIWELRNPGDSVVVRYRITLPAAERAPRAAWRPFLTPAGGLTGGIDTFMYVIGAELAPSYVSLDLPRGWKVATALTRTADSNVYFANSASTLMESPILVGKFSDWHFTADGTPHRIAYWPSAAAVPFDSLAFVNGVSRFAAQAIALFGRAPYRDFTFMFQDAAYGGLEHPGSVTLGVSSEELAKNAYASLGEAAHEYFHTWNLMRIRPVEYSDVSVDSLIHSGGLWFSEGLTMYYADALRRRAGLETEEPTRIDHLAETLERYYNSEGTRHFSADSISRVAYNTSPLSLGDYSASEHLAGEVLGTMLDFIVRSNTAGSRTMDDVMRLMLERHSGRPGYSNFDVQRAIGSVCGCEVATFFGNHVRGAKTLDVARYLQLAGLGITLRKEAVTSEGVAQTDLRIYGRSEPGENELMLRFNGPDNIWVRGGLHAGDRLVSMNGTRIKTRPEFRSLLGGLRMSDTVNVVVRRGPRTFATRVGVTGYKTTRVSITSRADASPAQQRIRERWLAGW